MEAKAGWETTSGLLYYLSVAEPVPKIIPAICMPCFSIKHFISKNPTKQKICIQIYPKILSQ